MPPQRTRSRWTERGANAWYAARPWLVGCNFIPSTASNQLEMWQAATFDEPAIERELGWAQALGFNTVRVYLHDLLWLDDRDGFVSRVDRFLALAAGHRIQTMFVLLDGVWDPRPQLGPQREPRPHVHNSRWLQSPGAAILGDPDRQSELEEYVKGIVGRFRDDERIVAWDLFNEPDNPNPAYRDGEIPNKAEMALLLLGRVFEWAREARPSQPLTSGIWNPRWARSGELGAMDNLQLEQSDIISFHLYAGPKLLNRRLEELARFNRPLFITEYLARPFGSTFEAILPVSKQHKIAAYNWGFVAGRSQTQYPWDSWTKRYDSEPGVWFHDVLRPDGTAHIDAEAEFIRRVTAHASD